MEPVSLHPYNVKGIAELPFQYPATGPVSNQLAQDGVFRGGDRNLQHLPAVEGPLRLSAGKLGLVVRLSRDAYRASQETAGTHR